MDRIGRPGYCPPCDKIFPRLPDGGQESHEEGDGIPAAGCGREISEICLYGELLKYKRIYFLIKMTADNSERKIRGKILCQNTIKIFC